MKQGDQTSHISCSMPGMVFIFVLVKTIVSKYYLLKTAGGSHILHKYVTDTKIYFCISKVFI